MSSSKLLMSSETSVRSSSDNDSLPAYSESASGRTPESVQTKDSTTGPKNPSGKSTFMAILKGLIALASPNGPGLSLTVIQATSTNTTPCTDWSRLLTRGSIRHKRSDESCFILLPTIIAHTTRMQFDCKPEAASVSVVLIYPQCATWQAAEKGI